MNKPWFDEKSNMLIIDEYVVNRESFKKILSDGVITSGELKEQSKRVIQLLKELEDKLDEQQKETATDALCELAVLYELMQRSKIQF